MTMERSPGPNKTPNTSLRLSTALRNYGDVFGVRRQSEAATALWIPVVFPSSQIENPKRCRAALAPYSKGLGYVSMLHLIEPAASAQHVARTAACSSLESLRRS